MIFEKHRFEIWNMTQHPLKHTLEDFAYSHDALPNVTNVQSTLDWILAVLYPKTVGSVADQAALNAIVAPQINDYYVVADDGDGKAAGYRREQREGDLSPKWYKIYDMDWGEEAVLSQFLLKTQDMYVYRHGIDDVDSDGNVLTGAQAGQHIFGGQSANTHLTLHANSGDGTGAQTGFLQFADHTRPTSDNALDLGTTLLKFKTGYFGTSLEVANLSLAAGSIMSASGSISFGDENLSTTGNISGAIFNVSNRLILTQIATPSNPAAGTNALYIKSNGKLYTLDSAGNEAIVGIKLTSTNDNRLVRTDGTDASQIQESGVVLNDSDELSGVTLLDVDNLRLDGNTLSSTNTNGDINITPNGTGFTSISRAKLTGLTDDRLLRLSSAAVTASNVTLNSSDELLGATKLTVDNLELDGSTLATAASNANLVLTAHGTGILQFGKSVAPSSDNTHDIGAAATTFKDIYLKGEIKNGTLAITMATLFAFRDTVSTANDGDIIAYNTSLGKYVPQANPVITAHSGLTGLGADDHTQYLLLAGRAAGQSIIGGTQASDNLTLESTSDSTKGMVLTKDVLAPFTNASYSGGWSGTDLGGSGNNFRHLYSKGEFFGLRVQNVTSGTLPSSSAQNVGRLVYATDTAKLYIDTGTLLKVAGASKHVEDLSFNGTDLVKDVDVSANIGDARNAIVQLRDNSTNFEVLGVTLKTTSASNVRIETTIPLPAGTYRLIVME